MATPPNHGIAAAGYVGRRLWDRGGTEAGVIVSTEVCRLEGCGGPRLVTRWPDGKITKPCAGGCFQRRDGDWQIASL